MIIEGRLTLVMATWGLLDAPCGQNPESQFEITLRMLWMSLWRRVVRFPLKDGFSAFAMAVKQSNFECARLLMQKDPNFNIDERSSQGYTLLHHAAVDGNLQALKFLVNNGADITLFGPDGLTAAGWCEDRYTKWDTVRTT